MEIHGPLVRNKSLKKTANPAVSIRIIEILICEEYSALNNFITPVVISSIQICVVLVLKVPRENEDE
jgi:hypothetical protein